MNLQKLLVSLSTVLPVACAPRMVLCPDGTEILLMDCRTEVQFQGPSARVRLEALGAELSADTEVRALRQIGDHVAQLELEFAQICKQRNACVQNDRQLAEESRRVRERMSEVTQCLGAIREAGDADARKQTLARCWTASVPEAQRTELTLDLSLTAQRPDEPDFHVLREGEKLYDGARIRVAVRASASAHIYMFQRKRDGRIDVLFPHPTIPIVNPVPGGVWVRIPPGGGAYRVDDKDLGPERVYVVAALHPVANLAAIDPTDTAASKEANGGLLAVLGQAHPDCLARGLVPDLGSCAARPRGLVLENTGASTQPLRVRSEAADETVLASFGFEHVASVSSHSTTTPGSSE